MGHFEYLFLVKTLEHLVKGQERIERKVDALTTKEKAMSAQLDTLKQQVQANTDAEQSAIALLGGLKKLLDDALATGDPAALTKLSQDLGTSQQALAQAILVNTPTAAGGGAPRTHP